MTSFITNAAQDPHEYEASAQDRLALDKADVVVKNGGGYDPFIDALLESGDAEPAVLDAVEISGLAPHDDEDADEQHEDEEHADEEHADEDEHAHIEGFNEHVWYDFGTMTKVAEALGDELSELDPGHAEGICGERRGIHEEHGSTRDKPLRSSRRPRMAEASRSPSRFRCTC